MSFTEDEEILQDFLVEATEIIEQLGEQLVDLETSPQDTELLNAVFRGYHTIKGGAGFLNITSLVEICHRTEDVFNVLRQGERLVDARLMDVILSAHDVVTSMIESVRQGEEPPAADPALLRQLEAYAQPGDVSPDVVQPADAAREASQAPDVEAGQGEEAPPSVEQVAGKPGESAGDPVPASGKGDEITDEEFEALLDQLHGGSAPSGVTAQQTVSGGAAADVSGHAGENAGRNIREPAEKQASVAGGNAADEITDEEFEALLDQLHGGGAPGMANPAVSDAAPASAARPAEPSRTAVPASPPSPPAAPSGQPPAAAGQAVARPGNGKAAVRPSSNASGKGAKKESVQSPSEATVRVDTRRLDDIMNLVGELVLVRNRLMTLESLRADEEIAMAVDNLDLVTSDLQAAVMKTRMQPIKKVFGRFPRVVRDLARSLNKEITLELMGEETDLDKNLVEALADPLVHLVRNAVDHGIEMPDVREKAGKPRTGTVVLSAEQEGDHILLTITDDGAGMDAEVLRRKAVEKGVLDEEAAGRLSPQECYQLIFMPGFSTKEQISDVSGRGVGMDVVKTKITQLNGTLSIDSEPGKGTKIIIKVPLTLAIMPTLMIKVDEQILALPLGSVAEIFHLDLSRTNVVDGQEVVLVRDEALPLFYLKKWLLNGSYSGGERPKEGHVVVVHVGSRQVGFVVDKLLGQEEVVIKPLGALLHGTKGIAGATITGDGRISLILDAPSLLQHYAHVM